jgi:hypothetical protein
MSNLLGLREYKYSDLIDAQDEEDDLTYTSISSGLHNKVVYDLYVRNRRTDVVTTMTYTMVAASSGSLRLFKITARRSVSGIVNIIGMAIGSGNVRLVRYIFDIRPLLELEQDDIHYILTTLLSKGSLSIVKLVLSRLDMNMVDWNEVMGGISSLTFTTMRYVLRTISETRNCVSVSYYIVNDNYSMVKMMIREGANVDDQMIKDLFYHTIRYNDISMIQWLYDRYQPIEFNYDKVELCHISNQINLDMTIWLDEHNFLFANDLSDYNDLDVVDYLLTHHYDIFSQMDLDYAIEISIDNLRFIHKESKTFEKIKVLIAHGIEPPDEIPQVAPEVMEYLLDKFPNKKYHLSNYILSNAVEMDKPKIVKYILDRKHLFNPKKLLKMNPSPEIRKMLESRLQEQIPVTDKGNNNTHQRLVWAASNNRAQEVKNILSNGIQPHYEILRHVSITHDNIIHMLNVYIDTYNI